MPFLNLSLENIFYSLVVKLGSQMLGRCVLPYTGGCTSLYHHIDPLFNDKWRWKGKRKKKVNAFSILAAGAHITWDSSLRVSKALFIYF